MSDKEINPWHPAILLATWFGSGFLRPAPGTWGTLAALPFGVGLLYLDDMALHLGAIIIVSLVGLWAAHVFEQKSGTHDDKRIVIDEAAGLWIAMIPATLNPVLIVLSFILFRFFDILKPWPISIADRHVGGSLGVMLDDVIAGIFAAFILLGGRYVTGIT